MGRGVPGRYVWIGLGLLLGGLFVVLFLPSPTQDATGATGNWYTLWIAVAILVAVAGVVALAVGLGRWLAPRVGFANDGTTGAGANNLVDPGVTYMYQRSAQAPPDSTPPQPERPY